MPTNDGFLRLSELTWPITYTYQIAVPWGYAKMELTVEAPFAENDGARTIALGVPLYEAAIAPAISFLTILLSGTAYAWKTGMSYDAVGSHPPGQTSIFALGKEHAPCAILLTGHSDKRGRRRLYFPACPRGWIDSRGQLNAEGAGSMRTHLHGMLGGLLGTIENAPFAWLLAYPDAIEEPLTGFKLPGFRPVTHVRLCQYTVPFPDFVP